MEGRTLAERLFRVLEAVRELGPGVGLDEVTRSTGLPKPTALRLLRTLETHGAVEKSGGSYRLGLDLVRLGRHAADHHALEPLAHPYVREIARSTGGLVWLVGVSGSRLALLGHAGDGGLGTAARPLPRREQSGAAGLTSSAVGRVVLSQEPELAAAVTRGVLPRSTPRTIQSRRIFLDEIRRVKGQGIAVEHEQLHLGWSCVAAPVLTMASKVVGVLAVSAPTPSMRVRAVSGTLLTAVDEIRRSLAPDQP